MTGHYSHATNARGRFGISGIAPDLENLEVLAVPKPGQPYFLARALVPDAGEAVVDCPRGIPFRLTLRDKAGCPVEADVTYSAVAPNPNFEKIYQNIVAQAGSPLSRAAAARRLLRGRGFARTGRRSGRDAAKSRLSPGSRRSQGILCAGQERLDSARADLFLRRSGHTLGRHVLRRCRGISAWLCRDRARQPGGGREAVGAIGDSRAR